MLSAARCERPVCAHDAEHRGVDLGHRTELRGGDATTEAKLPARRPHGRDETGGRGCGPLPRYLLLHDEVGADQRHGRVVEQTMKDGGRGAERNAAHRAKRASGQRDIKEVGVDHAQVVELGRRR